MPRSNPSYDKGFRDGYKRAQEDFNERLKNTATDLDTFAIEETAAILAQRMGYFRVGMGADGDYWTRYKWTRGPLEGLYTLASGQTLGLAFSQTAEKVHQVEAGKLKAHPDKPARKYPPKG